MVRRSTLALFSSLAFALALGLALDVAAKPKTPAKPYAMRLRSIDLVHRLILVEVDGFTKPPPSNFFAMTDDRQRHYVAQTIHCDPPQPSGARDCELEIPLGYERHPLVSIELHVRGLHGRTVAVEGEPVKAAWAAALEAHEAPLAPPSDGGVLDSGVPRADAGR
jgi:hypothetical protein